MVLTHGISLEKISLGCINGSKYCIRMIDELHSMSRNAIEGRFCLGNSPSHREEVCFHPNSFEFKLSIMN